MTSPYRILTFDIVGTLIDFERGLLDALHHHLAPRGLRVSDQELLEAFAMAEDLQHAATPSMPWGDMLAPVYRRMAADLGLPDDEEIAHGLKASIPQWPAFPDSVDALRRLGEAHRLVAITNGGRYAAQHMAATLGNPFADIVTVEDIDANKPDPQVFAYCRGRQSVHGYVLEDYLHVAQSQYHDIGVAKRLGYRTAWVERRSGQEGFGGTPTPKEVTTPDYHVTTLAELADLLT